MTGARCIPPMPEHPWVRGTKMLQEAADLLVDHQVINPVVSISADGILLGKGQPLADQKLGYALEMLLAQLIRDRSNLQALRRKAEIEARTTATALSAAARRAALRLVAEDKP